MLSELKSSLRLLLLMLVLTGVAYPLVVTGLARVLFPFQATGSLIELDGKLIGSAVVGQRFSQPQYVHSRPSAAGRDGYDATQSGATNLSPTSKRLIADITTRAAAERAGFAGTGMVPDVPLDMITSSASGLDPDVSPAAAFFQVARVARVRRLDQEQVRMLVDLITEKRTFGVLGELRVNLLKLNLALDLMSRGSQPLP